MGDGDQSAALGAARGRPSTDDAFGTLFIVRDLGALFFVFCAHERYEATPKKY